jgi:multiple sugar transport system ATP-binding protein
MTQVRIRNLSKSYGKNAAPVLSGIDLEIEDREFVVLVGPSGCGKSTLLRMIAGLEEVSEGEIWIGEDRVNDLPPAERGIAMVFQDYALYPHMTVRENLAFGLRMNQKRKRRELSNEELGQRVDRAIELLGMRSWMDRKPGQLSGGQRQRVAIGRALVKEPRVFLFDEPLSNLDAQLRAETRVELASLHKRLGSTSIYVTHDQVEAMTLADRLVVLKDGVIQQSGPPLELYRNPANRFVASFLGTPGMNFLDGRLDAREGKRVFVFRSGDHEGVLDLSFLHSMPEVPFAEPGRGSLTLGIRPEAISVAGREGVGEGVLGAEGGQGVSGGQGTSLGQGVGTVTAKEQDLSELHEAEVLRGGKSPALRSMLRVEAQVVLIEPHGYEVQLILQVGESRFVARAVGTELRAGDACWVELEPHAVFWFDAQGQRLRFETEVEAEPLPVLALEEEAGTRGLKTGRESARERGERGEQKVERGERELGRGEQKMERGERELGRF